jgi:hypothetical protein
MRYLTAAAIVAACSLDLAPVQAQSIVCQQIGTLTFCNQQAPAFQQPLIQPWPYQQPPLAPMPLPGGPPVIPTYQQPYGQTYIPLPGNRR